MSANGEWKKPWKLSPCDTSGCRELTGWRYWNGYRWIYRCWDCCREQKGFTRDRSTEQAYRKRRALENGNRIKTANKDGKVNDL